MRKALLPLLLICCLLLTGCVPLTSELRPVDSQYEMPMPEDDGGNLPAVGDVISARVMPAVLYFPSEDGQELLSEAAVVTVEAGETLPLRLVKALLNGPATPEARQIAPEGTSVLSVRRSGNTAVVDLSMEARIVDTPRQLFFMRSAIVNTLCGVEGIVCVDVLIAGRAILVMQLACGAGAANTATLPAQWSQALSESELVSEGTADVSRIAVLYHPVRGSRLVVPEARRMARA